MEMSQIRFFLEVAKTEHITRSAEKLHISQPSLTQAIHRLEDDLGVPLFEQKGRNISITEYGKFLKDRLEPLMAQIDNIPYELKRLAKLGNETIHINVLSFSMLATGAIIAYKQKKKNVSFQLLQNPNYETFDIEIATRTPGHALPENSTNRHVFTCDEQIFLAVPDNEKYQNKESIYLREVADEGFISLAGSKQLRLVCDRFCHQAGFRPNIIFESDNPASVINMIGSNMGVGFYPEISWGKIKSNHVKLLKIADLPCRREIIITANLNKVNNKYVIDFYEFLTKYITDKFGRGQTR